MNNAPNAYLDEDVSILGCEKSRVVECFRRIGRGKMGGERIQEDPRALAPHFSRLGNVTQG